MGTMSESEYSCFMHTIEVLRKKRPKTGTRDFERLELLQMRVSFYEMDHGLLRGKPAPDPRQYFDMVERILTPTPERALAAPAAVSPPPRERLREVGSGGKR
jgi:antitoxin component HigA of HigAB toxin-antitoxin module